MLLYLFLVADMPPKHIAKPTSRAAVCYAVKVFKPRQLECPVRF